LIDEQVSIQYKPAKWCNSMMRYSPILYKWADLLQLTELKNNLRLYNIKN